MNIVFVVLQIIVSVALIVTILLQVQGSGLSTAFGASGEFYRSKRSLERLMQYATIVLAVIFAILSIVLLIPRK